MSANKLGSRTIQDFGEQWSRYTDNSGFYGSSELLTDIIGAFVSANDLKDKIVGEVGSGAGRIVNMLLAAGVYRVYAAEPSPNAFATLKKNTEQRREQVECLNLAGEDFPVGLNLDYIFSIGVIHHIPQPAKTIEACFNALKPGGHCLIWLYGKEGNGLYLAVVQPLRKLTVITPHWMLSVLCHGLNLMLDVYILLCRFIPLPLRNYMLNVIGRMSRGKRYLVIYDQLNPAYAKYYTEREAKDLLINAGFKDVSVHHRRGYSWTVIGTRPGESALHKKNANESSP